MILGNTPADLLFKDAQTLLLSQDTDAEDKCCQIVDQLHHISEQPTRHNSTLLLREIANLSLHHNKMTCFRHILSVQPDRIKSIIKTILHRNDVDSFLKIQDILDELLNPTLLKDAAHPNPNAWVDNFMYVLAQKFNNEYTPILAGRLLTKLSIEPAHIDWALTRFLNEAIQYKNTAFIDFILPQMDCNYDDAHIVSYAIHKDNWDAVEKIIPHLNEKNLHQEVFPQIVEERNLQALHFIYPYIDPNTIVAYYEKQKWNNGEEFLFITDFFTKKHLEKSLKEISPKESTNKRKI